MQCATHQHHAACMDVVLSTVVCADVTASYPVFLDCAAGSRPVVELGRPVRIVDTAQEIDKEAEMKNSKRNTATDAASMMSWTEENLWMKRCL